MIGAWLALVWVFVRQLVLGAINVSWLALRPKLMLRPGIIAYPLTVTSDVQITLLASMITLTPGTLSIDVSDDRRWLYVHAIDIASREAIIGAIAAGFETRLLRVLR
jgi:multicomponent Na+:H+ antiporter subunit E